MSIWADIRRRGIGKEIKKEDKNIDLNKNIELISSISKPTILFSGSVGQEDLDNLPHTAGNVYYVIEDCFSNGNKLYAGDLIIDDGSSWRCVNHSDWIDNSYIG